MMVLLVLVVVETKVVLDILVVEVQCFYLFFVVVSQA